MNLKKWFSTNLTEKHVEKCVKILLAIFVMVFSGFVLAQKVPEAGFVQNTVDRLEENKTTVMEFSGATLATSLAISALPDDFASPLANALTDMNKYCIFIFAVLFVEKLIVLEGTKISLVYMIPIACGLYILWVLFKKEVFKNFALKFLIFGMAVVFVIPFSTYFTEKVCDDYLVYVDETITEANAGAEKVNEIMMTGDEEATIFDKLSDAFKTAMQGMSDLLAYFENVIKKCVNSIAIMVVTTFVLPILVLFIFRWLIKELFSVSLPKPPMKVVLPKEKGRKEGVKYTKETAIETDLED